MFAAVVLVVDDDPEMREMLQMMLSDQGHQVQLVSDAGGALAAVGESRIDVVLSDLEMPRMDGLELARELHTSRPELPVIVMSAVGTEERRAESLEAGAVEFLPKPFSRAQILAALDRALGPRAASG